MPVTKMPCTKPLVFQMDTKKPQLWGSLENLSKQGLGAIASGIGNVIGSFRPGAQVFRNDYGPRNTTIYNGL